MDVLLRARDVDIPTDDHAFSARVNVGHVLFHLPQEFHLRGEILAAVGDINGNKYEPAGLGSDNSCFEIERRVVERRLFRKRIATDVETYPGVSLRSVPVAAITLELTQRRRNLRGRGFQFLETDNVGLLALNPLEHLRFARTNPVHVPGGDFQGSHDRRTYSILTPSRHSGDRDADGFAISNNTTD